MTLDAMVFGAFFGLIAAVAIYHLLMFAILRVPEFLSYGIYLAALAAFQLGREPQYLAVLGIAADANVLFWWSFSALAFFSYWLFRSFLSLRTMQPRAERIFLALTCALAIGAAAEPWLTWLTWLTWLANPIKVIVLAILIVAGWTLTAAVRRRVRVATYFGIAYAGFFAGAMMWFAWNLDGAQLGVFAPVFRSGVELGTVFQALTLALGLADASPQRTRTAIAHNAAHR